MLNMNAIKRVSVGPLNYTDTGSGWWRYDAPVSCDGWNYKICADVLSELFDIPEEVETLWFDLRPVIDYADRESWAKVSVVKDENGKPVGLRLDDVEDILYPGEPFMGFVGKNYDGWWVSVSFDEVEVDEEEEEEEDW